MNIKPVSMLLACLIFALCPDVAHCATVSYMPDVTSAQFWQDRTVYVAEVTSSDLVAVQDGSADSAATGHLVCKVTDVISGKPGSDTITISAQNAWLWTDASGGDMSAIKKGDHLLVIEPKGEREIFVIKVVHPEANDAMVESLKTIAKINDDPSVANLLEHATSDYDIVSQYCFIQLSNVTGKLDAPADYPAKLQKVADDQKRDGTVRVMANRLALRIAGRENDQEAEYSWLAKAIHDYTETDFQPMRPLMDRMLDLGTKRDATVKLLTGLVLDAKANMAVRIAAYNAILDKRAFHYANPDQDSEIIFSTCLSMLDDKDREIRRAGGGLLWLVVSDIANAHPEKREAYAGRAEKKLQDAIAKENDLVAKRSLQFHLQTIVNPPGPGWRPPSRP